MNLEPRKNKNAFEHFAGHAAKATGSTTAFSLALVAVIVWACTGPIFNFSETWQLVINTGTTIVTFLMVFLIQKAQNKDSLAIQLKLNELVASHEFASNRLVDIEEMTEEEMETIKKYYKHLSKIALLRDESLQCSHSIEEAEELYEYKAQKKKTRDASSAAK
ncbi:low affinity iron permease family protein [Flavobacterium caeni]|uniref:Low affinity Fe/Cu permease n=1 Tax=Flavobacterium caeni TaxID=490189 RepID=A0A1G5JIG0_9FLAO|nr:low affinity iron permease family protein [Flavobacterium caeni]SCY88145.1 Low affinity Fe/Cu permease [Flavobacterium caeni]